MNGCQMLGMVGEGHWVHRRPLWWHQYSAPRLRWWWLYEPTDVIRRTQNYVHTAPMPIPGFDIMLQLM